MSMESRIHLKRALSFPTGRDACKILIVVLLLGCAITLLQVAVFEWVQLRFERGSITFPFALAPVTRAGAATNLVGWGFMLNEAVMPPFHWLMAQLMLFVSAILVGRLLWWSPVIMSAGGTANLIELQWRGAVLDWIIIPMGSIIKAISLGDVAIFVGAGWCMVAVVAICIRGFHEIATAIRQSRITTREAP